MNLPGKRDRRCRTGKVDATSVINFTGTKSSLLRMKQPVLLLFDNLDAMTVASRHLWQNHFTHPHSWWDLLQRTTTGGGGCCKSRFFTFKTRGGRKPGGINTKSELSWEENAFL